MTEKARVLSIEGDLVTVGCSPSACGSCHSKGGCTVKQQSYQARNSKGLDVSPGDMVEIYLPPAKTMGAAFSIMILPLILFVAGFLAGSRLLGIRSEGINVLIGLLFLAGGFLGNLLFGKIVKKNSYPKLVQKVQT